VVVALVGLTVAVVAIRGPSKTGAASSATPSASASASPGSKTGTVTPPKAAAHVACGGSVPAAATQPKPQFSSPAQVVQPSKTYTATIRTSCGTIVVRLLAKRAPKTVNSFVFLADHRFFDGTQIHRIDTSIDVIQGGDPQGTGQGGPGYTIPDELTGSESYAPGVLAMANAGADTGGSQFFVVFGPKGHNLDGSPNYTIFGQVVSGLEVAKRIGALPIQNPSGGISGQHPVRAVYLEKVTISTGG
jgi:cyclophilin family peptidyl-prolyl cis-trans isomerase